MVRQFKFITLISVFIGICVSAGPSVASECLQENARYVDPESGLILSFNSVGEDVRFSQEFSIGSERAELQLVGFVTLNGEPLRPVAYVIHQCPDGDITGEELQACTIWQGVPYGRFGDGAIGLLPDGIEPAVEQILLPDFVRMIMSKPVWNELNISREPFEVFDFQDCGAQ